MLEVITPPQPMMDSGSRKRVFLAGSIEMGLAENWQKKIIEALEDQDLCIFNPRREDWNSNWEQSIDNEKFKEQVLWELEALEQADHIVCYLAPDTKAPVSLLELGLYARSGKISVLCPEGYWRKGNIDIVCERFGIPQFQDFEALIAHLKTL